MGNTVAILVIVALLVLAFRTDPYDTKGSKKRKIVKKPIDRRYKPGQHMRHADVDRLLSEILEDKNI